MCAQTWKISIKQTDLNACRDIVPKCLGKQRWCHFFEAIDRDKLLMFTGCFVCDRNCGNKTKEGSENKLEL